MNWWAYKVEAEITLKLIQARHFDDLCSINTDFIFIFHNASA